MRRAAWIALLVGGAAGPARAQTPGDDDVDLAALGLDPAAASFDDKLQIYGFADISFIDQRNEIPVLGEPRSFVFGNLNLYLAKNLTARWRTLAEVRFMFTPNGSIDEVTRETTTTSAGDPANFDRPIAWGGISIQRAYLEYDLHRNLTIRVGHWLTPYGIWNIDHGSPAIISTYRPYMIGQQFFPEHQTGLELFGARRFGDYRVGYHATVSNGRSPVEPVQDPDKSLGLGGRVTVEAPLAGTLRLGASGYTGRYTGVPRDGVPADSYDEAAFGVDAQWNHGGLHVQTELLAQRRAYRDGARALRNGAFAPDTTANGVYALAGYRFARLWNVMPYAFFERYHPHDSSFSGDVNTTSLGLNLRPAPAVVLKVAYSLSHIDGDATFGIAEQYLKLLTVQAAWVF